MLDLMIKSAGVNVCKRNESLRRKCLVLSLCVSECLPESESEVSVKNSPAACSAQYCVQSMHTLCATVCVHMNALYKTYFGNVFVFAPIKSSCSCKPLRAGRARDSCNKSESQLQQIRELVATNERASCNKSESLMTKSDGHDSEFLTHE
jgi:hypothetical protein